MLKNIIKLEMLVNGKPYQLLCDNDSPLEHVKEALFQFQKYIGQVEDNIKAQQQAAKSESEKNASASEEDPKVE
jgi:hypothetical protein